MLISKIFTADADRFIVGTEDEYFLDFRGGNDVLVTRSGSTSAAMGSGDDYVRVVDGIVLISGQDGADRFDVFADASRIDGGAGDDWFNVLGGSDHFFAGGIGDDRFSFASDATGGRYSGHDGNDLFLGYAHSISAILYGGDGNDRFLDFGNYDGRVVTLRAVAATTFIGSMPAVRRGSSRPLAMASTRSS